MRDENMRCFESTKSVYLSAVLCYSSEEGGPELERTAARHQVVQLGVSLGAVRTSFA